MPGRRELLHRVAAGRQEPRDARAEPHQLAARERPREVPRQVDDQQARERLHVASKLLHSLAGLPNRSNAQAQEEKRRLLLDAAVRVFARKGYHASRVGDIAAEAGVAHGLLYHYFELEGGRARASSARRGAR